MMGKYFSIKTINKIILFLIAIIILNIIVFQASQAVFKLTSDIEEFFTERDNNLYDDVYGGNDNAYSDDAFSVNKTSSYVVLEASTKRVLDGSNKDVKMEMASTTKIMTALVVLENCDLDKEIEIPKEAVGVEGSSIYLQQNQIWTIRDLLYGLMLRSGNDSAVALSIACAGNVEAFVDMMNAKAKELNLVNTHFDNPHGLHSDTHYTSAYDLAVLSACAMQNEEFVKIVSSKSYVAEANETHDKQYFVNKNKMLSSYGGANGIKTGYTTASGRCLVSAAKRDGMQLVCVVLNCYDMWNACANYMDKAFAKYTPVNIARKGDVAADIQIGDKQYSLAFDNSLTVPFKSGDDIECTGYFEINENIQVPVAKGSVVGKILFYNDNRLLFSVNIVNIEEINDAGVLQVLKNLVGNWHASYNDGEVKQIFSVGGSGIEKRCG